MGYGICSDRFGVAVNISTLNNMELDRIHIKDLSVPGIIGINPDERVNRQQVLVNATLWADTRAAATSDDIADAANYRTIAKALIAHIAEGEPMLVERLVQELVDVCFALEPLVMEVEMTVEKPGALRHARSVGITIHRSRAADKSPEE
jgi:dihydroneopterin aldolase/D-erythro-7,8-dihydroneopterin triphosphate epimerase